MSVKLRIYFYLLAAIVLGVFTRPAVGQDQPNVSDYIDPAQAYHTDNFDYMDVLNGRVALDIPLVVDHSQRGNLNFTYSLRYASTTTWYAAWYGSYYRWFPVNGTLNGVSFSMDGRLSFGADSADLPCGNNTCTYWADYAHDDNGSKHYLGTTSGNQNNGFTFVAESADGSGIQAASNSDGTVTLINRQGVRFVHNCTSQDQITDPNGNFLTFTWNSSYCLTSNTTYMTDTVGRTWVYYQGGGNTNDCPAGRAVVSADLWQVPGTNGTTRNFTLCYASFQISTNFGAPDTYEYSGTAQLMTAVILPDGTSWQFNYDNYGDLVWVQLPTGGTVTYTWSTAVTGYRSITQRTRSDGSTWNYTPLATQDEYKVTDPGGNDTVYNSASSDLSCDERLSSIQYYQGSAGGTLLKTVIPGYQVLDNPYPNDIGGCTVTYLPTSSQTQWPNSGPSVQVTQSYDFGFSFTDDNDGSQHSGNYGNKTWTTNYNYTSGGGGVLSRIVNSPYASWNSAYLTANLLDIPAYQEIFDANYNACSSTSYGYDDPAHIQHYDATQHTSWPTAGVAGNVTSVARWLSNAPCSGGTGTNPPSYQTVYNTGLVQQVVDARGNTAATNTYDTYFAGAYPTKTCNALNQCTNYWYDGSTGLPIFKGDPNGNSSGWAWDDMLRPTLINYADLGQTTITYVSPNEVQVSKAIASGQSPLSMTYLFDGLGRLTQTQLTSDPDGTDYTDTAYDAVGRVASVSNPHRNGSSDTDGGTQYHYDALNRVTSITKQDGSVETISNNANCTSVIDEAGKARESCVDGLGRTTIVWEDPADLDYVTTYNYDTNSNLISVTENGSRQRTFTYDSLSRLLSATNPESGTTNYTYDNNGNVTSRTDARGIVTNYNPSGSPIDPLNRVTEITYSDGTPTVHFAYDQTSQWSLTLTNPIGRLTEEYTDGTLWAGSVFGYDPMGRVTLNNQCTPAVCGSSNFSVSYGYDLLGDMIGAVNGAGVGITYNYDSAARPISVTSNLVDSQHPATLAQVAAGVGYYPTGQLRAMTLGNGLTESSWFDPRGGLERRNLNSTGAIVSGWEADPSGTIEDQGYAFGTWGSTNNGDITAWYSYRQNFYRTYTYDSVNRLSAMSSSNDPSACTGIQWVYDAWGNRRDQNNTGGNCGQFHNTFSQNNNRMDGYSYDANGNMLNDSTRSYTYDAENRITSVSQGGTQIALYLYDAEGRRVSKVAGSTTTDYVYDLSRRIVAEYPFGGNAPSYVYFNGQLLAEYANGTTYFAHTDHLGSPRLLTGMDQSVAECDDYMPFGERLSYSGCNGGITTHKFTGQERDSETGNDNFKARYYGSGMGRFLSPDPSNLSVDFWLPQTWNRYSYALNNPLSVVDRNGLWPWYIHNEIIESAFPGLSPQQMQTLEDVSQNMDNNPGQQDPSLAFEHSMSNGLTGQTPEEAEAQSEDFIAKNEAQAALLEAEWLKEGHTGISPLALNAFGNALHTITDGFSPAHRGYQPWFGTWWRSIKHFYNESSPFDPAIANAVQASQQAFQNTFGAFGDEFDFLQLLQQQQQQQQVTSQICSYNENDNIVCPQ